MIITEDGTCLKAPNWWSTVPRAFLRRELLGVLNCPKVRRDSLAPQFSKEKQQTKQEKHTCCRHNQLHNLIFFNILWIISQYNSQELLILWLPLQLNCMQQTEIYSRLSLGLSEMFFFGGKTKILKMIHLWTEGYIESFSDNTPWICFWLVVRFNHLENDGVKVNGKD